MEIIITPGPLRGSVRVIPSKSQAHRLLICAAFADRPTKLVCPETNRDMDATAACLNALGAKITRTREGYQVIPVKDLPESTLLPCQDSGSTLRFLLPVVGALGLKATFLLKGRLPQRPLSPLWEELERMGCTLCHPTENTVLCQGRLRPGEYRIDGGVSSQFVTGLLFALSLLPKRSHLTLSGKVESAPYIAMTRQAMEIFGVDTDGFILQGGVYRSPGTVTVEGDWSNGAFFLAAEALGNPVTVLGLSKESVQGDQAVETLLPALNDPITISAAQIPDLIPILSVVAACKKGAVFTDIRRLRLKESDRVAAILAMLQALGGQAEADENTLTVYPAKLSGGTVDSRSDHRIAMAAAIAATVCQKNVTILGAECVEKSYPRFWEEYRRLGGTYEQYLR